MPTIDERWAQVWRRLLGIGGGRPVNALEDVFPSVNLYEEHSHLFAMRGERTFTAQGTVAAGGAGQYGALELHNPVGSEHVIVIEELMLHTTGGNSTAYAMSRPGPNATFGVDTAYKTHNDGSLFGKGIPLLMLLWRTTGAAPTLATSVDHRYVPVGFPASVGYRERLVLYPGDNQEWRLVTANQPMTALVRGFEVPMHGGERS